VKKIIFTLSLLGIILTLSAQADDCDYNPYEAAQEELFLTSLAMRERYESDDCAAAIEVINQFHQANAAGNDEKKYNALRLLSFYQCEESYDFFETQIRSNPSETDRCHAIMFLAWMMNSDYLPQILKYAQRPKLSIQERAAIATAFMIFGVYDFDKKLKDESISILDEICYDAPLDVLESCILNYFNIGGEAAIDFFNSQLKEEEFALYVALFLAELGEHKTTFPIFEEALDSKDNYEIYIAVMGLAKIGTEEAIELILQLSPDKNKYPPKRARSSFDFMNINKGGEE